MNTHRHTKQIICAVTIFVILAIHLEFIETDTLMLNNYVRSTPNQTTHGTNLVIYIRSSPTEFDVRHKLRKLWIADIRERDNAIVVFVVGLSRYKYINLRVIEEQKRENDVVIFNFIDSYYMLSVKMFDTIRWHIENVPNADRTSVIWTNIDGYINASNLIDYMRTNNITQQSGVIHGECTCHGACRGIGTNEVHRNKRYILHFAHKLIIMNLFI